MRLGRLLGWIALACVCVVAFELVVYLTAGMLFTHIDTPECSSTNTFCYPDGRPGVTGGAVVVAVGNLAAAAVLLALLMLHMARRTATRARAWRSPRS